MISPERESQIGNPGCLVLEVTIIVLTMAGVVAWAVGRKPTGGARMKPEKHITETFRISLPLIRRMLSSSIFLLFLAGVSGAAQGGPGSRPGPLRGNELVKPFRIISNIYYVGFSNNTSYLITTPQGHILLDTTFESAVPQIRENIEQLGFHLKDIKILINAHAHLDHVEGLAAMKELTGAKVLVMAEDADAIADGGKSAPNNRDGRELWKPVRTDQILHDGEEVRLGGVTMVAHLTAGHTKGCTTWSTVVEENGRQYNVVFICSMGAERVSLIGNAKYPTIAEDYARSFNVLRGLPCDVFLVSHAEMFNLGEKIKRMAQGAGPNPFIDPEGYRDFIVKYEGLFQDELKKQRETAGRPSSVPPNRGGN